MTRKEASRILGAHIGHRGVILSGKSFDSAVLGLIQAGSVFENIGAEIESKGWNWKRLVSDAWQAHKRTHFDNLNVPHKTECVK